MAQKQLYKIKTPDGDPVQAESAIRDGNGDIIHQTYARYSDLTDGIYPSMDVRIVEMKIVYEDDISGFQNTYDYVWREWGDSDGVKYRKNDPRSVFLAIKTSPINPLVEYEIGDGRFVIRFDYPIRYNKKNQYRQTGQGCYDFAHSFYLSGDPIKSKDTLINSLIFVTPDDIKTTPYGVKYVYVKIPITEVANLFFTKYNHVRQEYILNPFSDDFFDVADDNYAQLKNMRVGGAIQSNSDISVDRQIPGSGSHRYYANRSTIQNYGYKQNFSPNGEYPYWYSKNKMEVLNYWCPLLTEVTGNSLVLHTRFSRYGKYTQCTRSKNSFFYDPNNPTRMLRLDGGNYAVDKMFSSVSVKPRCAIIDDDYEDADTNIWLRKYPQYEKRLWIRLGDCLLGGDHQAAVIVRFGISK